MIVPLKSNFEYITSHRTYQKDSLNFAFDEEAQNITSGIGEDDETSESDNRIRWRLSECFQMLFKTDQPTIVYLGVPIDLLRLILLLVSMFLTTSITMAKSGGKL